MNNLQTILYMMENSDLSDKKILKEIDARVFCADLQHEFVLFNEYVLVTLPPTGIESAWDNWSKYTRSRDALKPMRPDGWFFAVRHDPLYMAKVKYDCKASSKQQHLYSPQFDTEECAELYAIIQVIKFEEDNKK